MTDAAIMIVEDERIVAMGLDRRLIQMGYRVAGLAHSGRDAVSLARRNQPDLILMDIHLGNGPDGIAAAAEIREEMAIPVVFLTAHSDAATLERAKLTEPFGYVLKPYDERDLQTAIEIGLYRARIERRMRENQQWLAATLASIGDGVIATDARGRVCLINGVAEQLTGYAQAEALSRPIDEIFVLTDSNGTTLSNPVFEALERGTTVTLPPTAMLADRNGSRKPIDDSAAPIRDTDGRISGAVLVFRDISERRNLEEHLRQAQKMEAIGRLAGGIAHDFNNIMTVVIGFSEMLLEGAAADERSPLTEIRHAGKRAALLTQQIMAFSRQQVLVPVVLDLNLALNNMSTMIRRLMGSDIELVLDLHHDLVPIRIDETQLTQVLLNLAANARDAMPRPGGGRLTVATEPLDVDGIKHFRTGVAPGGYVRLLVSDTGSGMPPEVLDHLFEPFFTTKPVGQGTGLGLATVYGVVKQSGGHIFVSSAAQAGTTFEMLFPAIVAAGAGTVAESQTPAQVGPHSETILVVDDDAAVREMTCLLLRRRGFAVLEAADGLIASDLATRHEIDLLITDLVMPRMPGHELAGRLRSVRPDLPVIFMSGYSEDNVFAGLASHDRASFLRKPFTASDLLTRVREALRPLSP